MRIGRGWISQTVAAGLLAVSVVACGEGGKREDAGGPGSMASPDGPGEFVLPSLEDEAADVPLPDLSPTPTSGKALRVFGADLSWPQCPAGMGIPQRKAHGAPMPTRAARFVIIGLTNGPSFTPNPCLRAQVDWARMRNLRTAAYAVTSYPTPRVLARFGDQGPYDGSTRLGALRNVGYQAAVFNVRNLKDSGMSTPVVWVDVEPLTPPFAWSDDIRANRAVVDGTIKGFADAGYRVGLYSTQLLWRRIVGDYRLELPEWRAAGQTSQAEAVRRCGRAYSYAGGRAILGQWVEADRDRNVTCPGAVTDLDRWFGRF